jgi:hypothetical protein
MLTTARPGAPGSHAATNTPHVVQIRKSARRSPKRYRLALASLASRIVTCPLGSDV